MNIIIVLVMARLILYLAAKLNWRWRRPGISLGRMPLNNIFQNNYIESKAFYAARFKRLPCISFINEVDSTKAYAMIMERCGIEVKAIYQYSSFDYAEGKALFNMTIFVLKDRRMIEVGTNYVELLFGNDQYNWANGLLADLASCRILAERATVMGFVRPGPVNDN